MKDKSNPQWAPETQITFWINQASRLLTRTFEHHLRPYNFGMAYLPVAIALEENGEMQQKQLAEYAGVEQPTMAALLVRMERDGLISRRPNPVDKRSSYISLTRQAQRALPKIKEKLYEVVEQASSGMTEEECGLLQSSLQRMIKNLESHE